MSGEKETKSFWTTIPGVLSGCAAIITALAALIGALVALGIIGPGKEPDSPPPLIVTEAPPQPTDEPQPGNETQPAETQPAQAFADAVFTFDHFLYCDTSGIPYASFRFDNTGDVPLIYIVMKIDDFDTGANIYGETQGYSSTGFNDDSNTCGAGENVPINPGESGFIAYAINAPAALTARHTARASVTVCQEQAPEYGLCATKQADFVLYYP